MFQITIFYGSNRSRGLNIVGQVFAAVIVASDASM